MWLHSCPCYLEVEIQVSLTNPKYSTTLVEVERAQFFRARANCYLRAWVQAQKKARSSFSKPGPGFSEPRAYILQVKI